MTNTIMSVQVIPTAPEGIHPYDYVDQAIEIIQASGLKYEVHALETTLEGELQAVLRLIERLNLELVEKGALSVMLQVRTVYKPNGITSDEILHKYQ